MNENSGSIQAESHARFSEAGQALHRLAEEAIDALEVKAKELTGGPPPIAWVNTDFFGFVPEQGRVKDTVTTVRDAALMSAQARLGIPGPVNRLEARLQAHLDAAIADYCRNPSDLHRDLVVSYLRRAFGLWAMHVARTVAASRKCPDTRMTARRIPRGEQRS